LRLRHGRGPSHDAIVHDVARQHASPSTAPSTAWRTSPTASSNWRRRGAKVINDDVIYYAEPMFQDGPIAQAVDAVKAAGVAYFS
jgi:hypothetical protein